MRIEEKMLILPTLYIIKKRGSATTSDLIQELTLLFLGLVSWSFTRLIVIPEISTGSIIPIAVS